jgi:hypothetical protein
MQAENLHLKIEQFEGSELVIRHGEAEKIHHPGPITLSGDFTAPAEFVKKRAIAGAEELDTFLNSACHVLFNKKALSITLVVGEQLPDTITVKGSLKKNPFLDLLKIDNGGHYHYDLLKLIKQKGHYFESRLIHRAFVLALQSFEVKTETTHRDTNDRAGNTEKTRLTKSQSDLAGKEFSLNIPLFEGGEKAKIDLKIEVEPSNGTVLLCIVSETFEEFWDTAVAAQFDAQRPVFEPFVIIDQS